MAHALLGWAFLVALNSPLLTPEVKGGAEADEAFEAAFASVKLPYAGPGAVTVLSNGEIIVSTYAEVFEETRRDIVEGDEIKIEVEENVRLSPRGEWFFKLRPAATALTEADGKWSLAPRRAAGDPQTFHADGAEPLHSLADLRGELTIRAGATENCFLIAICDRDSGECFETRLRVGEPIPAADLPETSTSIECEHGSGSITVTGGVHYRAYCDTDGAPHCISGMSIYGAALDSAAE